VLEVYKANPDEAVEMRDYFRDSELEAVEQAEGSSSWPAELQYLKDPFGCHAGVRPQPSSSNSPPPPPFQPRAGQLWLRRHNVNGSDEERTMKCTPFEKMPGVLVGPTHPGRTADMGSPLRNVQPMESPHVDYRPFRWRRALRRQGPLAHGQPTGH
jgi:hypothetical protein